MNRQQAMVKVDWDCSEEPDMSRMHQLLQRAGYKAKEVELRRSPSGSGWHVTFVLQPRPTNPYEIIALQAILGGDPFREAMQMNRARSFYKVPQWMRNSWNVLYLPHPQRRRHVNLRGLTECLSSQLRSPHESQRK